MEKLIVSRGHILLMSPKCNPELAGMGFEYAWGASKLFYRRNNDCVPANLKKNVVAAMDTLDRGAAMMFERRARSYREALKNDSLTTNFDLNYVEKAVKTRRTHRNAADFDAGFIRKMLAETIARGEAAALAACENVEWAECSLRCTYCSERTRVFSCSTSR